MSIDALQHAVVTAVARAAVHEGTALGTGDTIDEIPETVVALSAASSPSEFVSRYGSASKALHANWTRRVGTPGYRKSLWMEIDVALSQLARAVAAKVGHDGPWVPAQQAEIARADDASSRPARAGDRYLFTYPGQHQFDRALSVDRVTGDGPDDLVFFDDHTHSKQKHLVGQGVERLPS
jgi:hypothetical protein